MARGESLARGRVLVMPTTVLTSEDVATLRALAAVDGADVSAACVEVAAAIGRTPGAVRSHLARLWGAGLVHVRTVRLTVDGRCVVMGRAA